jgi:NAD-dependent SIR2 family protein deacetylase
VIQQLFLSKEIHMAKGNMNIVRCKKCNQYFWMHLRKNIESGLCTTCLNIEKKNKLEKRGNYTCLAQK